MRIVMGLLDYVASCAMQMKIALTHRNLVIGHDCFCCAMPNRWLNS